MASSPLDKLAEDTVYVSILLADQPRAIDGVIDYFGDARPHATANPRAAAAECRRRRREAAA
jgi:hypothetical protein